MAANTYTTTGVALSGSSEGTVLVRMDGGAVSMPSEEEMLETLGADRFRDGAASLELEPYPGTVRVWRDSQAEDNLLDESDYTVSGSLLTIDELASDPVALVEYETEVTRELSDADFAGGAASLQGEPISLELTEDGVAVPYALDGTSLVVEGMGEPDGLVRATYSHAVGLTCEAGEVTLPDAPETVTVTGRTLGESPSEEEVTGWALDGSVLVIPEGWDEYVVTYSAQVEEEWSLSEQVEEEPAPDSDEGEAGDLEPEELTVGHALEWEPEGLVVTVDGTETTYYALEGQTIVVAPPAHSSRLLSLTYTMLEELQLASSSLRATYTLPSVPSGEVSVTIGGEAVACTVDDMELSVPSLESSQYVVAYTGQAPEDAVELPCVPMVQEGESVVVTVVDGSPMVTGVAGSGDQVWQAVEDSTTLAVDASDAAAAAEDAAQAAQEVAEAINQHFWTDDQGVHVTEVTQAEWETAQTGANQLSNSEGILLRDGLTNFAQLTPGETAFYDGQGNDASNVVASLGSSGLVLGRSAESHAFMDYHSMQLVDKEGDTYFYASDLRDTTGYATVTLSFVGDGSNTYFSVLPLAISSVSYVRVNGSDAPYTSGTTGVTLTTAPASGAAVVVQITTQSKAAKAYTIGVRAANTDMGARSIAEGNNTTASGNASHAEGTSTTASGTGAHSEGSGATASGLYSHAEGWGPTASGQAAHAEGYYTSASGMYAHAEGYLSQATSSASHAEGWNTSAGNTGHSEGWRSEASGDDAHAQNTWTIASGNSQTTMGKYNATDSTSALIIGNGTSDSARSNALTVDWYGNVTASGSVSATTFATANATVTSSGLDLTGSIRKTFDNIDSTTNPSTRIDSHGWNAYDKNGIQINQIRTAHEKDGRIGMGLVARQGTTDSGGIQQNVFRVLVDAAGNQTYSVSSPANFRSAIGANNASNITTGTLPKAQGGTGKTNGLAWTGLGSFTGTNSLTIDLTDYSEVCIVATFDHTSSGTTTHKMVTATVPKNILSTTVRELWLGGGKSAGSTANSGNLRAVVNITTTKVTGVNASSDSTDHTSGTTWRVYAR